VDDYIYIMSVLNNFILVCEHLGEKAYIYELDSGELWYTSKVHVLPNNTFKLPANAYQYERVVDAELIDDYQIIWILYSGGDNYHVVVTTFDGSVVRVCTKHFNRPQYISFSPVDRVICIRHMKQITALKYACLKTKVNIGNRPSISRKQHCCTFCD
jgi:hypothetical protein